MSLGRLERARNMLRVWAERLGVPPQYYSMGRYGRHNEVDLIYVAWIGPLEEALDDMARTVDRCIRGTDYKAIAQLQARVAALEGRHRCEQCDGSGKGSGMFGACTLCEGNGWVA